MLLDLKFSIGTLGIGSGAFIAALYGMNLKNFIEESDFGFLGVSGFSAVFAGIVCMYGLHKLRKVQRVSMWGEQGNRGSWRNVDATASLPGEVRADRVRRLREERQPGPRQQWGESRAPLARQEDASTVMNQK
jgi:magnesium transporter